MPSSSQQQFMRVTKCLFITSEERNSVYESGSERERESEGEEEEANKQTNKQTANECTVIIIMMPMKPIMPTAGPDGGVVVRLHEYNGQRRQKKISQFNRFLCKMCAIDGRLQISTQAAIAEKKIV